MSRTLFSDVMVFDGSGSDRFHGSVLVEGNRIAAVVPARESFDASDANVIEGKGRTLMPGMVEAHAHLTWPSSIDRVINSMKVPLGEHVAITENNARITLGAGFTSAYSASSLGEKI